MVVEMRAGLGGDEAKRSVFEQFRIFARRAARRGL
jgi:protein subunit release factor A